MTATISRAENRYLRLFQSINDYFICIIYRARNKQQVGAITTSTHYDTHRLSLYLLHSYQLKHLKNGFYHLFYMDVKVGLSPK